MYAPGIVKEIAPEDNPRSKYESNDGQQGRVWTLFSFGVLFANAFLMLKDVLYGGQSPRAFKRPDDGPSETGVQAAATATVSVAPDTPTEQPAAEKEQGWDPGHSLNSRAKRPALSIVRDDSHVAAKMGGEPVHLKSLPASPTNHSAALSLLPQPLHLVDLSGRGAGGKTAGADGASEAPAPGESTDGGQQPTGESKDPKPKDPPLGLPNRAPAVSGTVGLGSTFLNQAVVIGLMDLLQNVSDPDGDALTVRDLTPSSGSITARGDGAWLFTPVTGDTSEVIFSFAVSDGQADVAQSARLDLLALTGAHIEGSEGDDRLIGTPWNDTIDAKGGNDVVLSREGNDVIEAGAGNDRIVGGTGNDVIYGGDGNDAIFGDEGNDVIYGGTGNDFIDAGDGDDVVLGETGDDIVLAGEGRDVVFGGDGADDIAGGAGGDLLDGGAGDDTMKGDAGNDIIIGQEGSDVIAGDDGDDRILATAGDGDDAVDGGVGIDTYDLASTTAAAIVDLRTGTAASAETGSDQLANIENVVGSWGNDAISGDDQANVLTGGSGDDTLLGGANADRFVATAADGDDAIDGGVGIDTYDLASTTAPAIVDLGTGTAASAETGSDQLANIENVVGSWGNDAISGDDQANVLTGGSGDDTLLGGANADRFVATAGDGDDAVDGGVGIDTYDLASTTADAVVDLAAGTSVSATTGSDVLASIENAVGGSGNDRFVASEAVNIFTGNTGDDVFVFSTTQSAGNGPGSRDTINDFSVGDRIDLDDISREFADQFEDALKDQGIRKFVLIKEGQEFSRPGELRIKYETFDEKEVTVIEGNIDWSAETEFEIQLVGRHENDEFQNWNNN